MRKLKKGSVIFMIAIMTAGLLAGCGPEVEEEKENDTVAENEVDIEDEKDDESIKVEEGIFDVSITVPPGMVEDMAETDATEDLKEEAREADVKVIENEDGSLTYKMSKATHSKMMSDIREEIDGFVEETLAGDDFPTVKDIEYGDDLTSVVITVSSEEEFTSSFDAFIVFGIGLQAMFYQLFDGVEPDDINVVIDAKDLSTGEVFGTTVYPEDLED